MIIERLELQHYGNHRDVVLDLRPPKKGIVLVAGPNEAGKSTTMRAIDALLFGIPHRTEDHYGSGRPSLRLGARLVSRDGHAVELDRNSTRKPLCDKAGGELSQAVISELMGGVDQRLFTTLFRIDHERLDRESKELLAADGEIGRLLFGASLGMGVVPVVQQRLDARTAELYKPNGSKPVLNESMASVAALRSTAKQFRMRPRDWDELVGARGEVVARLAGLGKELAELDARRVQLDRGRRIAGDLQQRARSLALLAELAERGPIANGLWCDEVERLLEQLEQDRSAELTTRLDLEEVERRAQGISFDAGLLDERDNIAALVQALGAVETQLSTAMGSERELEALRAELAQLDRVEDDGALSLGGASEEAFAEIEQLIARRGPILGQLASANNRLEAMISDARRGGFEPSGDWPEDEDTELGMPTEGGDDQRVGVAGAYPDVDVDVDVDVDADAVAGAASDGHGGSGSAGATTEAEDARRGRLIRQAVTALEIAEGAVAKGEAAAPLRAEIAQSVVELGVLLRDLGLRQPGSSDSGADENPRRGLNSVVAMLESFEPPTRSIGAGAAAAIADLQVKATEGERNLRELRDRREERVLALRRIESDADAPTAAELEAARADRDQRWSGLRSQLEGEPSTDSLATEVVDFERSVHASDALADARYRSADLLAQVASLQAEVLREEEAIATAEAGAGALQATLDAAQQDYAALWPDIVTGPPEPAEVLAWFDNLDRFRKAVAELERKSTLVETLERAADEAVASVAARVSALGPEIEVGPAALAVADAKREIAAAEQALAADRARREVEAETLRRIDEGRAEVAEAESELAVWTQAWELACASVGLHSATEPDLALGILRREGLRANLRQQIASVEVELDGARVARESFEARARALLGAQGSEIDVNDGFDAIAAGLISASERLQRAIEANATLEEIGLRRAALNERIDRLVASQQAVERRLLELHAQLAERSEPMAVSELEAELRSLVGAGRAAEGDRATVAEAEKALLASGDGYTVSELVAESEENGLDSDGMARELSELAQRRAELEKEVALLNTRRGELDGQLSRIDGSEAAADAEQEAAERLAVAAEAAEEYLVTSTAAELLRRVVADFADRHQGPIVRAASAIFERITEGRYVSVTSEILDGVPVVYASTGSGEERAVHQLSTGTRDQLYLALRLATVLHHYEQFDVRVPLILDDVLVNFDDERKRSTLQALAELASQAQILMFTHEASLVQIAERTLGPAGCSVVEMARPATSAH